MAAAALVAPPLPSCFSSRGKNDVSLMPEGLVGSMTVNDLADIVEFLSGQKPNEAAGGK